MEVFLRNQLILNTKKSRNENQISNTRTNSNDHYEL